VLQIAVHGDDDFASGSVNPAFSGRSLPKTFLRNVTTRTARICCMNIPKKLRAAVVIPSSMKTIHRALQESGITCVNGDIKRGVLPLVKDGYDDPKTDSSWP